nr:PREDICTED: protein PAXX isoform X2 [Rhinolophus sinicus]
MVSHPKMPVHCYQAGRGISQGARAGAPTALCKQLTVPAGPKLETGHSGRHGPRTKSRPQAMGSAPQLNFAPRPRPLTKYRADSPRPQQCRPDFSPSAPPPGSAFLARVDCFLGPKPRPRSSPRCRPRPWFRQPPASAGAVSRRLSSLRCHGADAAAAAVAASLHAAAGPRARALRVLLRGRSWGQRPRRLQPLKARFGLNAAEDITRRFRAACEQQAVAFTLQEDGASLTVSRGPLALDLNLSKVPGPEAATRLQALTLGLAERVCSLERRLTAAEETAASPRKSARLVGPQQFLPDPDPQRGIPGPGVRRRCPGESLINPGFKSKKPASGVDFDDL